jgi:hypothetical protein
MWITKERKTTSHELTIFSDICDISGLCVGKLASPPHGYRAHTVFTSTELTQALSSHLEFIASQNSLCITLSDALQSALKTPSFVPIRADLCTCFRSLWAVWHCCYEKGRDVPVLLSWAQEDMCGSHVVHSCERSSWCPAREHANRES